MIYSTRIKYILFFTICFWLSNLHCKRKIYSDKNYFGGKVIILGHTGMGESYAKPGNTWEAIIPVIAIGADGAEVDIQMTKDTVLVLFHDDFLNDKTSCTGRVYEKDWAEIKQCKYSSLSQYDININSVDEMFSKVPNLNDCYFSFDCSKVDEDVSDKELYRNQYLRAIKRLCDKYNMSDHVFIEGEGHLLLKAQQLGLTNKLFLYGLLNPGEIDHACNNHFYGISTSINWLNDNVSLAHQKGLYVMAWSPDNCSQNKIALDNQIDIIQTDDPITILRLLNRYNHEYVIP